MSVKILLGKGQVLGPARSRNLKFSQNFQSAISSAVRGYYKDRKMEEEEKRMRERENEHR